MPDQELSPTARKIQEDLMRKLGGYVPTPVTPTENYPFPTDRQFVEGGYPHETQDGAMPDGLDMDALTRQVQQVLDSQNRRQGPEDVPKTIGMNIEGQEFEVPAVFDNMTDQDRAIIQGLPHSQWPQWIKDAIENNARDNLEQGNDPYGNPPPSL